MSEPPNDRGLTDLQQPLRDKDGKEGPQATILTAKFGNRMEPGDEPYYTESESWTCSEYDSDSEDESDSEGESDSEDNSEGSDDDDIQEDSDNQDNADTSDNDSYVAVYGDDEDERDESEDDYEIEEEYETDEEDMRNEQQDLFNEMGKLCACEVDRPLGLINALLGHTMAEKLRCLYNGLSDFEIRNIIHIQRFGSKCTLLDLGGQLENGSLEEKLARALAQLDFGVKLGKRSRGRRDDYDDDGDVVMAKRARFEPEPILDELKGKP
ncbi:hypothetical protein QQZ08_008228 [Neonectria magnoliae]|uniref:Uncharacterized protein n=1 Tax=Neonectria magnoliae TaxID=2732573 RepID=A0ABR1HWB1_9HYPO